MVVVVGGLKLVCVRFGKGKEMLSFFKQRKVSFSSRRRCDRPLLAALPTTCGAPHKNLYRLC